MHRFDRGAMLSALIVVFAALLAGLLLFMSGCTQLSLIHAPAHPAADGATADPIASDACTALNKDVMGWTASSIALGVLSGGSGVASLFTSQTPRYAAGGISVGLTAFAGVAAYLSTTYAAMFTRQCTNAGGP